MTRFAGVAGAAALATLFLAGPSVVRAECPYAVIPAAIEGVRTAREVIVGTVIENVNGEYSDFRLRIDYVLRGAGRVGDVRRFEDLYPNWPPARTDRGVILADDGTPFMPCAPIPGWKGNVIALALGALAPDGETRYNAASWISGRLPFNQDLPRTTLAEVTRLAALPDTATSSDLDEVLVRPTVGVPPLLALAGGLAVGILGGWWIRRPPPGTERH